MSEQERKRRFDAVFSAHSGDIDSYCHWRSRSDADAQDAAADVFLMAWRRLDRLPEGDALRVWLYATARRVLANQRRSFRRRAALQERLALEAAAATHEPPPLGEETALVHEACYSDLGAAPAVIAPTDARPFDRTP